MFFFVLPDGRGTAVTERLDGSDRVVLPLPTGTLNLGSGPISPDGTQLVLFLGPDGDPPPAGSLWIVFLDGTGLRQLTPEASQVGCCMNYRWSPDGSRILFADAAGVLWTIAPDGSDLTQVFRDGSGRYAITPTWSPDGSMIMFALDPTPNPFAHPVNGLYVIRADGSALTEVIATNDFKREPVWVSR